MLFASAVAFAQPQQATSPADRVSRYFTGQQAGNGNGEGFSEDKYGYKLKPEMRSFKEVIVHVASGNIYGSKAGRGEQVSGMSWIRRSTRRRLKLWRCCRSRLTMRRL